MDTATQAPAATRNPCDRIKTREAWARLNKYLVHAVGSAPESEASELAAFMSDTNIELHEKFGVLEAK